MYKRQDHGYFHAGNGKDPFESPLNDAKRRNISGLWADLSDDPFDQENRDGTDQIKDQE